jgi:hypothetical protein
VQSKNGSKLKNKVIGKRKISGDRKEMERKEMERKEMERKEMERKEMERREKKRRQREKRGDTHKTNYSLTSRWN